LEERQLIYSLLNEDNRVHKKYMENN
jgi:hypothetical protein